MNIKLFKKVIIQSINMQMVLFSPQHTDFNLMVNKNILIC